MALFTGTWMLESQKNYDGFMKSLGSPEEIIQEFRDVKIKTTMEEGDTFSWTKELQSRTWTNTFTIGKKCELEDFSGTLFSTTVTLDGGILQIEFPKYTYTAEMIGEKLLEVSTTLEDGTVWKKISKMV